MIIYFLIFYLHLILLGDAISSVNVGKVDSMENLNYLGDNIAKYSKHEIYHLLHLLLHGLSQK